MEDKKGVHNVPFTKPPPPKKNKKHSVYSTGRLVAIIRPSVFPNVVLVSTAQEDRLPSFIHLVQEAKKNLGALLENLIATLWYQQKDDIQYELYWNAFDKKK